LVIEADGCCGFSARANAIEEIAAAHEEGREIRTCV